MVEITNLECTAVNVVKQIVLIFKVTKYPAVASIDAGNIKCQKSDYYERVYDIYYMDKEVYNGNSPKQSSEVLLGR